MTFEDGVFVAALVACAVIWLLTPVPQRRLNERGRILGRDPHRGGRSRSLNLSRMRRDTGASGGGSLSFPRRKGNRRVDHGAANTATLGPAPVSAPDGEPS